MLSLQGAYTLIPKPFHLVLETLNKNNNASLFQRRSVKDLLWGYTDPILKGTVGIFAPVSYAIMRFTVPVMQCAMQRHNISHLLGRGGLNDFITSSYPHTVVLQSVYSTTIPMMDPTISSQGRTISPKSPPLTCFRV